MRPASLLAGGELRSFPNPPFVPAPGSPATPPGNEYKIEFLLNVNLYATLIIYDR